MHTPSVTLRSRALVLLGLLGLAAASVLTPTAARAADDPAAVAWSVETVDGAAGTDRPNFAFAVDPGAVLSDALRVTNTGATALDLAVYAADAYTTTTGNIDLNTPDVPSTDAGTWVAVDVDRLSLAPGQQADIPFTIAVPADAAPGDHSAGIITSLSSDDGGTLSVDRRLATRVDLRVSGELAPAVQITDLRTEYVGTWNPFAPGTLVVDYRLVNIGNTRVAGDDTIIAEGPFGLAGGASAAAALHEVLRGSEIDVRREIEVAPWGLITGSVTVQPLVAGYGAQRLDDLVADFSVPAVPWALLAIFVVIAAAVTIVVLLVRRRSRGAVTATGEAAVVAAVPTGA